MTSSFMLPPRPVPARERAKRWFKAQQLKLWLPAMSACESLGVRHWSVYYWLAGKVSRANAWRFDGRSE